MTEVFLSFFEISLSISVLVAALLLLAPLLGKRYAAKWKYLIWIFFALRLVVPVSGRNLQTVFPALRRTEPQTVSRNISGTDSADSQTVSGEKPAEIQTVSGSESAGSQTASGEKPAEPQATLKPELTGAPADGVRPAPTPSARVTIEIPAQMTTEIAVQSKKTGVTPLDIVACVWLAGCLIFLSLHIVSYLHYKRRVKRLGHAIEDVGILNRIAELKGELHITRAIAVINYPEAGSPMILGFLRPVLVLPEQSYREEDLFFILKHELVHVKRGDVFYKLLFVAANAVHWFNPLIYLMQKEAAVDMELSCDERVLQGADYAMRKAYTETLLFTLHKRGARRTVLSTQFYEGKQVMKRRFKNILSKNGKKNGIVLVACAVILSIGIGTLVGCSTAKESAGNQKTPFTPVSDAEKEGNPIKPQATTGKENNPFQRMAGNWMIDFDRTDPTLFGTGISYGDMMTLSTYGEFSYYIGIGVGGTGQCEEKQGEITVKIKPYEEVLVEEETLTLKYINEDGNESILMDWNGEAVYWKRKDEEKYTVIQVEGNQIRLPEKDVAVCENGGLGIAFETTGAAAGSCYHNIYRSLDGGISWNLIVENHVEETAEIEQLYILDEQTIYCAWGIGGGTSEPHVRVSRDAGMTWDYAKPGEQFSYVPRGASSSEVSAMVLACGELMDGAKIASLYLGEGYSLYVPFGDWMMFTLGSWRAEKDERVRFFVSSYEGLRADQVERILSGQGYTVGDNGLWKQEGDTVYRARICETEHDVWTLNAVYPSEAEDGWEAEIQAIFDTFEVLEGYEVGANTLKAVMPEGERLKLYEETYTDANSRAWAVHDPEYAGSYIYNQLTISNVTDDSFDFTITRRNFETEETETVYPLNTAYFNEDGVSATFTGNEGALTFDFSDDANPLPVVRTIKLWGEESLEGIRFYSSNIPGYETD